MDGLNQQENTPITQTTFLVGSQKVMGGPSGSSSEEEEKRNCEEDGDNGREMNRTEDQKIDSIFVAVKKGK